MKNYPLIISYDPKQLSVDQVVNMHNSFKQVSNTEILLIPNSLQVINNLPVDQLVFLRDALDKMLLDKSTT